MLLLGYPSSEGLIEVALPSHLAFQSPDRLLGIGFDKQAQTGFHRRFFGADTAVPHRLAHQAVVNVNVGPQSPSPICNILIFVYNANTEYRLFSRTVTPSGPRDLQFAPTADLSLRLIA